MKVLITGASGLIGQRLSKMLSEKGYEVAHLVRKPVSGNRFKQYGWNLQTGEIDAGCIDRTEAIIHLAGASVVSDKWTKQRKIEIIKSRTDSIKLLYTVISEHENKVNVCISAGGIGFYGDRGAEILTEESLPGTDFLSSSCIEWEEAVNSGKELGLRICQLRTGMVLSSAGGALKELEKTVKLGLGAPLGRGTQYMSWIHIDDLCRIYIKAIENKSYTGIYNAVAPNPVINEEFTRILAAVLRKPLILPHVPELAMQLILGERKHVVLDSDNVSNEKLLKMGFEFQFKLVSAALIDIYAHA